MLRGSTSPTLTGLLAVVQMRMWGQRCSSDHLGLMKCTAAEVEQQRPRRAAVMLWNSSGLHVQAAVTFWSRV